MEAAARVPPTVQPKPSNTAASEVQPTERTIPRIVFEAPSSGRPSKVEPTVERRRETVLEKLRCEDGRAVGNAEKHEQHKKQDRVAHARQPIRQGPEFKLRHYPEFGKE